MLQCCSDLYKIIPNFIKQVRWYAHGDCYEEDRTLYYCSMCDIFASPDHFATQPRRAATNKAAGVCQVAR
jgi:hypothetical protein